MTVPETSSDAATPPRRATRERRTAETRVRVVLDLDRAELDGASGVDSGIDTGVGFLDHMLTLLARHGGFALAVAAEGDRHVDDHHTVEDVGIVLGEALAEALGSKAGIRRYGSALLPMDEALARVALDLSGRPFLVFHAAFPAPKIGSFDAELVREFFQGFASAARVTLHAEVLHGLNAHHMAEALFKGLGRALREAVALDPREQGRVPSTKGAL